MLARLLRVVLLIELLLALGLWFWLRPDLGSAGALLWVLALALLWRFAVVVLGFVLAGGPDFRCAGAAAALRAVAGEFVTMVLAYGIAFPFFSRRRTEGTVAMVILIHGFACNGAVWWWFRRAFEAQGWRVLAPDLEPRYRDLEAALSALETLLDGEDPARPLLLIGHSMGGLAACLVAARRPERVAGVVALGAPHNGTRMVRWLPTFLGGPPGPETPWLPACRQEVTQMEVPLLNVLTVHENIVVPASSARLPRPDNLSLAGLGHLQMTLSPTVRCAALSFASPLFATMGTSDTAKPAADVPEAR